jgi:hypothetical protein
VCFRVVEELTWWADWWLAWGTEERACFKGGKKEEERGGRNGKEK